MGEGKGTSPQSLRKELRLADTLVAQPSETHVGSHLQKYKMIEIFVVLNHCSLLTAAVGNYYCQIVLDQEVRYQLPIQRTLKETLKIHIPKGSRKL